MKKVYKIQARKLETQDMPLKARAQMEGYYWNWTKEIRYEGDEWIHLALVNMVTNFRFPWKTQNFLLSWVSTVHAFKAQFSTKETLQPVCY